MSISKQQILASLAAIEAGAPPYFGDMPVADDVLRDVVAAAMAGLSGSPDFSAAAPACREATLLGLLTHVLVESACLRHQLHTAGQSASHEAGRLIAKAAAR